MAGQESWVRSVHRPPGPTKPGISDPKAFPEVLVRPLLNEECRLPRRGGERSTLIDVVSADVGNRTEGGDARLDRCGIDVFVRLLQSSREKFESRKAVAR